MRLFKIAIISFLLFGCDTPEERTAFKISSDQEWLSKNLEYYKDVNKNVCFAGAYVGYNFGTITYVPCTPEIERTAHQFHSNQTVR
jgi:hypothetical protein